MDAIMRLQEVKKTTGLGTTAIYARIRDGRFPKPVPLGVRHVGWLESEVQEWI